MYNSTVLMFLQTPFNSHKGLKLFLFFVILLLSLFVFYHNYSLNRPSIPKEVVVNITDDGFYPDKVVISPSDTITFINKGERPHWPASNFHPTHTLYPEQGGCLGSLFDACRGLLKGESYSFTFTHLGIWPVHDHLFPGLLMVIEVSDNKMNLVKKDIEYDKVNVESFRKLDESSQIVFIKKVSKDDPKMAWDFLKQAFIINGQVVGNAHEFSHIIGNEAYRQMNLDAVQICDQSFAFGCFHGVTEAMLLKEGPKRIKDIESGCLKFFPPQISTDYTGCIHGAGHGVYTWEAGNLGKALKDCDIFDIKYRPFCYDGVFMENASNLENNVFNKKDPWKICTDLDDAYHYNCARYQSQVFLTIFNNQPDFIKQIGENCAKGPTLLLSETCYQSLGFFVSQNSMGKVQPILDKCSSILEENGVAMCIIGASMENIFQKYPDFKSSANTLCGKISGVKKEVCFNNINRMIQ